MRKATDLSGQRFGRLCVQGLAPRRNGRIVWRCLCDCGAVVETRGDSLRAGSAQSCGCLSREAVRPAIERIMEKVVIEASGCWVFQGSRQEKGHGLIRVGSRRDNTTRLWKAHRVVYEHFIGPIPDGLVLDHVVCTNPPCVNPWHLEPVTHGENTRRARLAKTHCKNGHLLSEVGYVQLDAKRRMCAVCNQARRAREKQRRIQRGA